MHLVRLRPDPAARRHPPLGRLLGRLAMGLTVAIAVFSAGLLILLQFSDSSASPIVADAHPVDVASAPIARITRREPLVP